MKTCLDCGLTKPLDEFPVARKRRDGRGSYCRLCMNARSLRSRHAKLEREGQPVRVRPMEAEGQRWCPDCGSLKPLEAFPRNRRDSSGRGRYCKPCHNARGQDTRQRLYGGGREYHLQARYGIGQAEVDAMLAAQGGACAGCGKPDPEHVDHDHATGKVRGLLCFNCNQALGNVRDDLTILGRLQDYLLRHSRKLDPRSPVEVRLRRLVVEVATSLGHPATEA